MNQLLSKILLYIRPLFNTKAAGVYLILFAIAIGAATFIENDFGTSSAQKVVFKARWFELLLVLFSITIIVNIFKFRMIQTKKWALLIFHSSIVIIVLGAAVTRYWGFEGMMHIREDSASNSFLSRETYLKFQANTNGQRFHFDEPVHFASLGNNDWEESYLIGNQLVEARVKSFIPNPKQVMYERMDGKPTVKIVVAGMNGREEYFVSQGQTRRINQVVFNFNDQALPDAFNISWRNDSLLFKTQMPLIQRVMATQTVDTLYPSENYRLLRLRALYTDGQHNFVFGEFQKNASVKIISEDPKVKNESTTALLMDISVNGQTQETMVFGNTGLPGRPQVLNFDQVQLAVSYGSKEVVLPFSIKLYDFIMDKYPGTNTASSYASEVQLIDERNNLREDYRIYMNNILNYEGYRFFQSSFDQDEKGTYLSVNHDFWGTTISYLGYALLTIGMIWTFFSKKTRFFIVKQRLEKLRAERAALTLLILLSCSGGFTQTEIQASYVTHAVQEDHAREFSKLIVQDYKGRMKPMHTLAREIMRKLARKESLFGLTPDQIVLSMYANSQEWYHAPVIKLGRHPDIAKDLGVNTNFVAYKDFFDQNGKYKLQDKVRRVHSMPQADRGTYEKDLLKTDEKVNVLNMTLFGSFFKIVPNPNDPNNTWSSTGGQNHNHGAGGNEIADKFFHAYQDALRQGITSNNYAQADQLLSELYDYQQKQGNDIIPSETKISGEILLNKLNVFNRLTGLYMLLGLAFLSLLFYSVFKPKASLNKVYMVLFGLMALGFVLHAIGLGLRWYVSGRAPWSNGYESMIYIAWTTTLAGVIFARKSFGALAATTVQAGTILFVATLSFLDPEITPLVPVLKSYWLTIHVSLEAGSYGFLMLGAVIGLINLLLMIVLNKSNAERVKKMIQEMSYMSELTITAGLVMVSIGTYLGGVWANESWGRYWGWDPKETWALVTILVYAFILHMRIIPKLFGLFSYNLTTFFGLATVIMTYYGVNYYLSGLHSYAAGDPVPIPMWVYYSVIIFMIISVLAYIQKRRFLDNKPEKSKKDKKLVFSKLSIKPETNG